MFGNGTFLRRLGAYFIDIILIGLVAGLINQITIINPTNEEYQSAYEKQQEAINEYLKTSDDEKEKDQEETKTEEEKEEVKGDNKATEEVTETKEEKKPTKEELQNIVNDSTYYLAKYGIVYTSLSIVLFLGYFVIFQKFNNGQTLGKQLLKIKVQSVDGNKPGFVQLLVRSLFIYEIIPNLVSIALVLFLEKDMYLEANNIIAIAFSVVVYASLFTLILRKDGRGIHDLVAKTEVVDIKNNVISESIEDAKEAEYTEVKKEDNKKQKKNKR